MLVAIFVFISYIIFCLIMLKYLSYPFVFILGLGFCMWIYFAVKSKVKPFRLVSFNFALFFLLFLAIEVFFTLQSPNYSTTISNDPTFMSTDKVMGTKPIPSLKSHVEKIVGNKTVYNVNYTIDSLGMRESYKKEKMSNSILFFGCSFIFGVGLEDNETIPYIISQKTNYQTYNFGGPGYGPQQMLALIDHDLVAPRVVEEPTVIIYEAIFDHIFRSIGLVNGTCYEWKDDKLYLAGYFQQINNQPLNKLKAQLNKSQFINYFSGKRYPTEYHVKLFVEMVKKSKESLAKKYPNASFHCIFWPSLDQRHEEWNQKIFAAFAKENVSMYKIDDIITDFSSSPEKYTIYLDNHPNKLANEIISDYIINRFLE